MGFEVPARVGGEVAVAEVSELTAPVSKNRLVDLGSLSPETAGLPPREEPGFFRRVMNMFGF